MKKKVLAAVLSLSMILSTGVVAMADETKDPSEVKVGVITDVGGVNDGSFNQSAWEGLTRANEELGITTNYLNPIPIPIIFRTWRPSSMKSMI